MNHDVIVDRYARLYEQPRQLAELGHDVLGLCLSYRAIEARDEVHETRAGSLHWVGLVPGRLHAFGLPVCIFYALKKLQDFQPDIIVGASDLIHIILAEWFAKRIKVPFSADLYDHFETFGLAKVPGLIPLYRKALRNAVVVTCVSELLANLVEDEYQPVGKVLALPSTIDHEIFHPYDRLRSRELLGLPKDAELIGTAGGLYADKGIRTVYEAFLALADERPSLHLVLAGPIDPGCPPPNHPRVCYLGKISHARIPVLFSALDVGIIYLRDTLYGRYSFPQKAYEIASCAIPFVAADVGSMSIIFQKTSDALYKPDDELSLLVSIRNQLENPTCPELNIPSWRELGEAMSAALSDAVKQRGNYH